MGKSNFYVGSTMKRLWPLNDLKRPSSVFEVDPLGWRNEHSFTDFVLNGGSSIDVLASSAATRLL